MRFTNDGTVVMAVTSVDVTGADAADFAVTPGAVPASLLPEGQVDVDVGFRPTAPGTRSALLRVTSNAHESPHLFPLDGFGTPALPLTIDPTVRTFAPGPVGGRSAPSRMTLVNNGAAPVTVAAITIGGPHAADFAVLGSDCLPPATVAVGASCGVDLVVTPSAVGPRTAQLRIEVVGGEAAVAELIGAGVGADLAFDPPDTDFGTRLVGATTDLHEVLLTNRGNTPVLVDTLGVEGDFVYASACAGNVLGPGRSCTVRLRMQATTTGPRTGRIVAGAGGQEAVATLHGIGAAPAVGLDPAAVTFPSIPVGRPARPVTITVTNTGTWPLTPHSTVLRGPDATDFALLETADGAVLASGESRSIRVGFTPGVAGDRSATLEFEANVQAGPHRVPLTGRGAARQRPPRGPRL